MQREAPSNFGWMQLLKRYTVFEEKLSFKEKYSITIVVLPQTSVFALVLNFTVIFDTMYPNNID